MLTKPCALTAVATIALVLAGCDSAEMDQSGGVVREEAQGTRTYNFDRNRAGDLPATWVVHQTHAAKAPAEWKVVEDRNAPSRPNVMSLTRTDNEGGTYNLLILSGSKLRDLDITVKMRANTGKEDQGGGLVWRYKDENNYYVCRLNPLESNYRVYKVVDGKRIQLQSVDAPSNAGQWYTLRANMMGRQITCYLDGRQMLSVADEALPDAGQIGFWTKADAACSFDDLSVKNLAVE
jgi:hypothetical protein